MANGPGRPGRPKGSKRPKVPGQMPKAPTLFDPTSNYGRTKPTSYLNTSLGHRDINNDHRGYFNKLNTLGGVNPNGLQPFHQWLNTSRFDQIETGYNNSRLTNPKLTFAKYMQTTGVPGNAENFKPSNTGNSFTSSSAPVFEGSTAATLGKRAKGKGKGKGRGFSNLAFPAAGNVTSLDDWMASNRAEYAKLTPEQSGEYMAGYTMGPARWSVYG